ncbi:potassium channel subfamily K member 1-like isoform X2 [Atheta coriaria]|uniref:potassium channel subfamily K member 1-like isoform X2 n=1 Tax=Dalotia coriaria TaxID=877792 RepID=UPI0031F3B506
MALARSIRLLIALIVYIGYLCLGAVIFRTIEIPHGKEIARKFEHIKSEFLLANAGVSDEDLERFIAEVVAASNRGISALHNVTDEPNWSFGQSLFFSGTVVTTIGYGHVTPLSRAGKAFCIIYAIFGIPFTLVLLSALVERLLVPVVWFLEFLNTKLGHLYQPFKIRILHLLIVVVVVIIAFMLIPAGIFAALEPEWDYLDSLYYCFISLTTIGLGDYIPGDAPMQPMRTLYKILTTAYLIIGITFIMTTLAVFYDIPQLNLGLLFSGGEEDFERLRLISNASKSYMNDADPKLVESRNVVKVKSRISDNSLSPPQNY